MSNSDLTTPSESGEVVLPQRERGYGSNQAMARLMTMIAESPGTAMVVVGARS